MTVPQATPPDARTLAGYALRGMLAVLGEKFTGLATYCRELVAAGVDAAKVAELQRRIAELNERADEIARLHAEVTAKRKEAAGGQ